MLRVFFLVCLLLNLQEVSAEASISVDTNGNLLKDGKPYQAIGVNYFSSFYRTILNPTDKSYKQGFAQLSKYNIPFARVMLGGFWPNELKLYRDNPELYFKLLDEYLKSAEENNIGIIASLNWNAASAADIVGEPASYVGIQNSKTQKFIVKYAKDVLKRYSNNKTVWIWEFGNELMLNADLPNSKLFRPATDASKGTPLFRNPLDELASKDAVSAFNVFANEVLAIKPDALLSTGNSLPRPYAWHNTNNKNSLKQWDSDTPEQFCQVLLRDNPAAYKIVSIHVYPNKRDAYFGGILNDYDTVIKKANDCSKNAHKALFIGEFGVNTELWGDNQSKEEFMKILEAIKNNKVPLAAVWVFDFNFQSGCCNVNTHNQRKYQLEAIQEFNLEFLKSQ